MILVFIVVFTLAIGQSNNKDGKNVFSNQESIEEYLVVLEKALKSNDVDIESFSRPEQVLEKIKNDLIKFLLNLNIVVSNEEQKEKKQTEILSDNKKVGRNEKCPCGSGKKYKHCCGSI